MSRKEHTSQELRAFSLVSKVLKNRYKGAKMIKDQKDKPDFGFTYKNKKFGIEVSAIENSTILESVNAHSSKKMNKARKKKNTAIQESKPYTVFNETTCPNKSLFEKVMVSKFEKYNEYIKEYHEVFLILHCEVFKDSKFYEILKINLNNYCLDSNCPYKKIYLVDLRYRKFIGKVFDKNRKKRLKIPDVLKRYESETRAAQVFPVGVPVNLYGRYKL